MFPYILYMIHYMLQFFSTLFLIQSIIINTERKTLKKLIEIKCTFDSFQIKINRVVSHCKVNTRQLVFVSQS